MDKYAKCLLSKTLTDAGVRVTGNKVHRSDLGLAIRVLADDEKKRLKMALEALEKLIDTAKGARSNAKSHGKIRKEDLVAILKEVGALSLWTDTPVTPQEIEQLIEKAAPKEDHEPYLTGKGSKPTVMRDLSSDKQRKIKQS